MDYTPKIPNIFIDGDYDGVEDSNDNCSTKKNADQKDSNNNGIGDVCESGDYNDHIMDVNDNCRFRYNPFQQDSDKDRIGDVCDI